MTTLGRHHLSHLHAVAEGLDVVEAAQRYLAVDGVVAAKRAHRELVDRVAAIARRRGDSRWRLLAIEIRDRVGPLAAAPPPIEEWAASEGLHDWSQAELVDLYQERFGAADAGAQRRAKRNARLRDSRLQLLRELEGTEVQEARATDLLEGWVPEPLAGRLKALGLLALADLQRLMARGGRWWSGLRGFGPTKAARLAGFVEQLLGEPAAPSLSLALMPATMPRLSGQVGANRVQGAAVSLDARDDQQAVRAWIDARAGSPLTAKQYEREAERFILWCVIERGRALSDATAEDCRAYMEFLAAVPDWWITRRKVARMAPGWAPFRGPLTLASQGVAIKILTSLFAWLVQARYLVANPWVLVNRKLGDDAQKDDDIGSRAFTKRAWAVLVANLEQAPPSPSRERLRWICTFTQAVGLRAAELLQAKRSDLKELPAGWVLRVHGKGRRNRVVPVPSSAIKATKAYFAERGIPFEQAPAGMPLLTGLRKLEQPISYSALHETFTRFVRRALRSSSLAEAERSRALRASTHWLRHTHATRAAEDGVPADVVQENLGQSDPRTTAGYYRAQIERRQREMERVYGEAVVRTC